MRCLLLFLTLITLQAATVDGRKVWYTVHGDGKKNVALIHGWTCDETFWDAQVSDLIENGYRVITIEMPGHGHSEFPVGEYSMNLFARAVDAALTEAEVSRAVLVGHSMGGVVVRQFARMYPRKTVGMVFVDAPF